MPLFIGSLRHRDSLRKAFRVGYEMREWQYETTGDGLEDEPYLVVMRRGLFKATANKKGGRAGRHQSVNKAPFPLLRMERHI